MTIEFSISIVWYLAGSEPVPKTGCLSLEAGTIYEYRGQGLYANKLYAVLTAKNDNGTLWRSLLLLPSLYDTKNRTVQMYTKNTPWSKKMTIVF